MALLQDQRLVFTVVWFLLYVSVYLYYINTISFLSPYGAQWAHGAPLTAWVLHGLLYTKTMKKIIGHAVHEVVFIQCALSVVVLVSDVVALILSTQCVPPRCIDADGMLLYTLLLVATIALVSMPSVVLSFFRGQDDSIPLTIEKTYELSRRLIGLVCTRSLVVLLVSSHNWVDVMIWISDAVLLVLLFLMSSGKNDKSDSVAMKGNKKGRKNNWLVGVYLTCLQVVILVLELYFTDRSTMTAFLAGASVIACLLETLHMWLIETTVEKSQKLPSVQQKPRSPRAERLVIPVGLRKRKNTRRGLIL